MRLVRPQAGADPVDQILRQCAGGRAVLVLLAPGPRADDFEPLHTLSEVLGDELPLVAIEGFSSAEWTRIGPRLADELRLTTDQARRAAVQTLDEHRIEVLFVEHGQVRGSALTVVDRRRSDGMPLSLNVKVAAMDILAAGRDCGLAGLAELCVHAREALGIPAGPVGRLRRTHTPGVTPAPARPAAVPLPKPAPPPKKETPAERHSLDGGRCTRCGRSGPDLEGPCGRPDLGRMGVIELD